jgi:hypothetical protein
LKHSCYVQACFLSDLCFIVDQIVNQLTNRKLYNDYTCETPFYCRVIVDAEGNATHMGKVSAHFDFLKDHFVITGGTGCFEGATGEGYTDDYNRDSYPDNSFHHWTGTITLLK